MKTNCKAVKQVIRTHIQEYYTPEELKTEIEGIKCPYYPTAYHAAYYMAEGGCFLIYTCEINDFINSLGINSDNKQYDDEKTFKLYCHLIAREAQAIINQVK